MTEFIHTVLERVRAAEGGPVLTDNVDPERFPRGMPGPNPDERATTIAALRAHAADWTWLADQLTARERELLGDLLVFRVLGPDHARVGPSIDRVRELLREAENSLVVERDVTRVAFAGSPATHRFDLSPLGVPIRLESYTLGIQGTFQLEQYRAPDHPEAWPRAGDVAIDAGACFGETALWLAHAVGPDGHVESLEFAPVNLGILAANLAANPDLAARIGLTRVALWERSGEILGIEMGGPASSISAGVSADADASRARAVTVSLDDLVEQADLARVDFVKFDIEGAEPAALAGATGTLARWRPRLAIAAYHALNHPWQLARALDELDLGYRFGLGHFTMHAEETVLYAWAD